MEELERLSYDEYAEEFAAYAEANAFNALYDRPAVLAACGDVAGMRVLDLGCGPGLYAAEMVEAGATVVGIDSSPNMVRLARARVPAGAEFRVHDLNQPMPWLDDAAFDLAVMALVIHHLDNRLHVLREAFRALRTGGSLVVSTHHPTSDWQRLGGSYFDVQQVTEVWQSKLEVRYWRQPLQRTCDEFIAAGFTIDRLIEPMPPPDMRHTFPDYYDGLAWLPGFIVFRLRKP